MLLTKYNNMIKAVPSDRADEPSHNSHSAMAIAAQLADPECPSPEDAV